MQDAKLLMSADDLHVAQFVTWWNDKSDWGQRKPPTRPLTCFDDNRCYSVMAGGVNRAGTELLYFNLAAPLRLAQTSGEYPPEIQRLEKARETADAWVDLTAPYWWDLPMLVALGQVDSIEVLNSRFCRRSLAAGRRRRQAAGPKVSIKAPAATPAGRRTSTFASWTAGCGFRPAPERLGRGAQSGRLQPRLRSPRRRLQLAGVVEEPSRRTGRS